MVLAVELVKVTISTLYQIHGTQVEIDPFVHTGSEAIEDKMVSSLLNIDTQWDIDLIQDICKDRDIHFILFIPLQNNAT